MLRSWATACPGRMHMLLCVSYPRVHELSLRSFTAGAVLCWFVPTNCRFCFCFLFFLYCHTGSSCSKNRQLMKGHAVVFCVFNSTLDVVLVPRVCVCVCVTVSSWFGLSHQQYHIWARHHNRVNEMRSTNNIPCNEQASRDMQHGCWLQNELDTKRVRYV